MARIWQEGFEAGPLDVQYMEGRRPVQIKGFDTSIAGATNETYAFPGNIGLGTGRNAYSKYCLQIHGQVIAIKAVKVLDTAQSEVYFRAYVKVKINEADNSNEVLAFMDEDSNYIMSLYSVTASGDYELRVKTSGTYQSVKTGITFVSEQWYKVEFYLKIDASAGAYEFKIDDVSQASGTSDNTGTSNIKKIHFGQGTGGCSDIHYFDDLALNDTSGSINNSWAGSGTILALKPKGAGNYSQWDTCKGYAKAEAGTSATSIKITGHGLTTSDIIYNKTRNQYEEVTAVPDADTITVASITGQAENDIILMYQYQNQITNTIGTTTGDDRYCTILGHNLQSGDVFKNVDLSEIRRVVFVDGENVYCALAYSSSIYGVLGNNISAMNNGDIINTYKFKPYDITNHYEATGNAEGDDISYKYSYIQSNTTNDIDSFDMEELVADKGLQSGVQVNAVSLHAYAHEAGSGSQFQHLLRISSTDYVGDTKSLSGGTLDYQHVWNVSPSSSARFTQSEIDALETGVKVVS